MISIVLPTYNGSRYIKDAVNSILKQSYTNFELIIVDDCSTDDTGVIADELAKYDERVRVIHNKINRKLPASLNIGFENAHGDYFTWTSDDNLYKSNALEIMLVNLEEDSQIDIVYAMYDTIDSEGNLVAVNANQEKQYEGSQNHFHNWVGACFLYKREVHDKLNGYDENLFLIEDFDFWLRAARYFTYKKINQNLYQYRIHDKSLTNTRNAEVKAKTISLLQRELEQGFIRKNDTTLLYKHFVDYYYIHIDNTNFRKYMKLLRKTRDNRIRIDISYRLAEIVGIGAVKKMWKRWYAVTKKKNIKIQKEI